MPSGKRRKPPKGLGELRKLTPQEAKRREDALEAGGYTREERRRSRQRKAEAARLAARRIAKASKRP